MLGESKANQINYGTVVTKSNFFLRVKKTLEIVFLSFMITLIPYFLVVKYSYNGGVSEYFGTILHTIGSKIFTLIANLIHPILSTLNIPISTSQANEVESIYDKILYEHNEYFIMTVSAYIFVSTVLSYYMLIWMKKKGEQLNDGQRVRSDEVAITDEKGLIKLIKSRVKNKKNNTEFSKYDLFFSKNLRIPFMDWFTHFAVCGSSRTGKSNFIKSMLTQARTAKMKGCIVDVDGDYLEIFYKPGDIILSLYDVRSMAWDFWHEPSVPASFFSDALLSPEKDSTEFFDTAGGKLLASLIRLSNSHEEFWRILCLEEESLLKLLDDNKDPIVKKYIGRAGSDQGIGAVASSIKNLDFVKFLNHHPRTIAASKNKDIEWFSFYEWVKRNDDSFVFIIAKDNEWEESKPLIKVQVETFVSAMFERGESRENIPVVLVMDELHKIGKLQVMEQLLSRGSKFYLTAFAGYQNNAQVESIFGQSQAKSIFTGLQNLVAFKCTDAELANQISERLGKVEVEITEGSMSSQNSGNNVSIRSKDKSNVSANQIMSLEKNCAWVKLAYYPPCYLSFDYVNYEKAKNEDGTFVQKTISVRSKKSWIEEVKPLEYYFGKNELKKLIESYANYTRYSDLEKVATITEILREIAFKVQHNEYCIDDVRYSFEVDDENITILKEENDEIIFSKVIKRSKKKEKKKDNAGEIREGIPDIGTTDQYYPHEEVTINLPDDEFI